MGDVSPQKNYSWRIAILPSPNTDGELDVIDIYKSLMYVCYRVSTRLQHAFFQENNDTWMHFLFFLRKISVLHPFPLDPLLDLRFWTPLDDFRPPGYLPHCVNLLPPKLPSRWRRWYRPLCYTIQISVTRANGKLTRRRVWRNRI